MRLCTSTSLIVRNAEFGGPAPLICVPLVAGNQAELLQQATFARALSPDVVEWRADAFDDLSLDSIARAANEVRGVLPREALIFTLRAQEEGGAKPLPQTTRGEIVRSVLRSGHLDIVDVELGNGPDFVGPIVRLAHEQGVRVILSFHDFQKTPANEVLLTAISDMVAQGADIAKLACMPLEPGDVLRLLEVTLTARRMFPAIPLCTMSMGGLGILTRTAGFLFGSDMSFAVGQAASAPGQIPIADLRAMIAALHRHA
ncbi:MAG: type I 3-dehydroquinate dehydratase [Acidobacteria bacterium]|nr:type I 3-dehydroquinate dehydratase [Acidobacteriota bacterium]